MSTIHSLEAVYEPEDDRADSERRWDAYHAAVQHLDDEDVLAVACSTMALHAPALLDLVRLQRRCPYEDVSRAVIHPSLAQAIAHEWLEAIAASFDCLAEVHHVVEARA